LKISIPGVPSCFGGVAGINSGVSIALPSRSNGTNRDYFRSEQLTHKDSSRGFTPLTVA
jgi:hypothetical protein